MAKKVKITKGGQTVYPATVMDAVVHPDLRVDSSKLIEEVNVSKIYPTGGIDGTNKYTLETAIAKIPSSLRNVGLKCSFLNEDGELETWEYQGSTFTSSSSWKQSGAGKLDELNGFAFTNDAIANSFIKEIYLEGWDGSDLYINFLTLNDGGKATIIFSDSMNTTKVHTYKTTPATIMPLNEGNNSGISGYICIDMNLYQLINVGGGDITKMPKISKLALSIDNCSTLRAEVLKYLKAGSGIVSTNTNSESDAASSALSWSNFIQRKIENNTNLFTEWDSEEKIIVEKAILSAKISAINNTFHPIEAVLFDSLQVVNATTIRIFLKNQDGSWIIYNTEIAKGNDIDRYIVTYSNYISEFVINWNELPTTGSIALSMQPIVNYNKKSIPIENETGKIYPKGIFLKNLFYDTFDIHSDDLLTTISTNEGIDISKVESRYRFVVENHSEASLTLRTQTYRKLALAGGHKYVLFYDILIDNETYHYADSLGISMLKYGSALEFNIPNYPKSTQRYIGAIISDTVKTNSELTSCSIQIRHYNNTKTTEKVLDYTFNELMLIDITEAGLEGKTEDYFRRLFMSTGYFDTLVINSGIENLSQGNQLYTGLKLRSLGDSLPETLSFQHWIADAMGMTYNSQEEVTTEEIQWEGETVTKWRSVWGGTRVQPLIVSSTESTRMAGGSIYMRAKSLKYSPCDVLIILAGYNDVHAGRTYIDGGTAVQPDDYGLNDEPYLGDEIDLVSNPTFEDVPSFGACYRGMIENILTDMPYCRLILCGIPRGFGEAGGSGIENDVQDKKNAVIEKIAKEYGFPFVNLADLYGVNKFNANYLTKDLLHFGYFGGKRVAMEILAKAF